MSKKIASDYEKECPICGGKIWGRGVKVLLEGAKITVCQSCAQFGVKIKQKPKTTTSSQDFYAKPKSSMKKVVHRRDLEDE